MKEARFKNDNRGNPSKVMNHMISQMEEQIKKMTGKSVRLIVQEKDRSVH